MDAHDWRRMLSGICREWDSDSDTDTDSGLCGLRQRPLRAWRRLGILIGNPVATGTRARLRALLVHAVVDLYVPCGRVSVEEVVVGAGGLAV